jgi:glutamate synthase (NADPH/NADH) large chain/glutamate synthase (ferredoxin)
MKIAGFPPKQGMFDPQFEKDSCGVGMVTDQKGRRSHQTLVQALEILRNLKHRGAEGSDPLTGDGAGVLTQIPHAFLTRVARERKVILPDEGDYAVGMVFLPPVTAHARPIEQLMERLAGALQLQLLGWRPLDVKSDKIGPQARTTEPVHKQVFIARGELSTPEFERKLYLLRRRIENGVQDMPGAEHFYIPSLSTTTIVYKGLLLPEQISAYYTDLAETDYVTAIALVHSRFSTNTFPAWRLAHPYRYLCHNGEINTLRGNLNWMRSRQSRLQSDLFGKDLGDLFPIVPGGQSDSACLDNALEFLVQGGRSLAHSMMMLIPEPWTGNPQMNLERRGFYEFQSAMMEPWDGPAAVCFTDGRLIGATLDRNGLRPCRFLTTRDDRVILSSEAGVLPVDPADIVSKGRLQPGRMLLVDTVAGKIIDDEEIKDQIARQKPYRSWVNQNRVSLDELPAPINVPQPNHAVLRQLQQAFGYTIEELKMSLLPMVVTGEEPTSSMGNDAPLAVLSQRPQLLFKYFRQMFAQVTNPPIDPIREQLVMSLVTHIGPRPNLLGEMAEDWRRIKVQQPILTNEDLTKIREIADPYFKTKTIRMLFHAADGPRGLRAALVDLCRQAARAVKEGYKFIILSDRGVDGTWAPIPSLLAISAVHHHLVGKSVRAEVGLIVESAEPRDVHQFACLIAYGAGSINPYLIFESLTDLGRENYFPEGIDTQTAHAKYIKAINKGLLKIFSKMGISTIQSYCGSQLFEAVGLQKKLVDQYFTGTPSRVEGIGLAEIAREALLRHGKAYAPTAERLLEPGGDIHYRIQGEHHAWNPETIAKLQRATRSNSAQSFAEFSTQVDEESRQGATLRGLLEFKSGIKAVPIESVEQASEIVKRFTTGAMSFGALGKEAHETLAVAMNRIGAKSNSGEGGEDPARFTPLPSGDSKNSAIKQIASARFGVTAHYLINARELQIKMAQGAKPGEGGQLPGHKVDEAIALMRYATPGVQLISPPPHHDIYSIEDLKQLIFDLKNANSEAEISVKLVAEAGVGAVAAGVAKAGAGKILISGDSGGTGASPLSSIKYAGIPWEMGLAETHQTLVLNGLRGQVRLETDGQLKTGRDVVMAAILGAEEFGFSTAPLIVEGCIMMRKCHLNTCPVGIATQDPVLRARFTGQPEHVINYFFFVAEEVRALLAKLGLTKFEELIGRVDLITAESDQGHWKASGLDLSLLLTVPQVKADVPKRWNGTRLTGLGEILDHKLVQGSAPALERGEKVNLQSLIKNTDRTTGTFLSSHVARRYGEKGLADNTITVSFTGSAGQSFGAFLSHGITLRLEGEANDYVGKGLSGGKIVINPPPGLNVAPELSILLGNTSLYGATRGEAYFQGVAGERFAVRNSGALAVVEGTGDLGCEYMTGGAVLVLGRTGRNFAAGMSGGLAFVLDEDGAFKSRCNLAMVELEKLDEAEDIKLVRELLEAHVFYTQSPKARALLGGWEQTRERFIKVTPVDYKRALSERRARPLGSPRL